MVAVVPVAVRPVVAVTVAVVVVVGVSGWLPVLVRLVGVRPVVARFGVVGVGVDVVEGVSFGLGSPTAGAAAAIHGDDVVVVDLFGNPPPSSR